MKSLRPILAAVFAASCGNEGANDAAAADPATPQSAGRAQFSNCAICHSVRSGEAHRVGPNLFGVYGRAAGAADGFAYSKAMRDSQIVWTDETLDALLEDPQGLIRGNRMAYAGEKDAQTRADIIAYLKTLQ